jgi:predicted amidophosphoribosyltransferase
MVWYSDEALEAFAIVVWSLALVLFLVALALPCPLCRRNVKDWSTCCNKCVASLLGLVFVSHLVTSDEGTL